MESLRRNIIMLNVKCHVWRWEAPRCWPMAEQLNLIQPIRNGNEETVDFRDQQNGDSECRSKTPFGKFSNKFHICPHTHFHLVGLLVLSSVGGEIRQSNVLLRQPEKAGSCHMTLPRLSFSLAGMKEGDRKQLCNFFDYEDDTKKCCISCLDLIYVSVIKCWTVVLWNFILRQTNVVLLGGPVGLKTIISLQGGGQRGHAGHDCCLCLSISHIPRPCNTTDPPLLYRKLSLAAYLWWSNYW